MKKISLLGLLMVLSIMSFANHYSGYDLSLINIKNANGQPTYNYKWKLKLYRGVYESSMPTSVSFKLYANNSTSVVSTFTVVRMNPKTILSFPESDCYPLAANSSTEVGIYESPIIDYSGLSNASNYYVIFKDCCRIYGVTNLRESDLQGYTFTIDFPRLSSISDVKFNSSPEFKKYPSFDYKKGKHYSMDWSAVDLDGDSLVYKIIKPYAEDLNGKPLETVVYAAGYKLDSNIADGNPDFSINPNTGVVSYLPTNTGQYSACVQVEEYRNIAGVPTKIGAIYRDIQFNVITENNPAPILVDNTNRGHVITDTVTYGVEYILNLKGWDNVGDSLYLNALPSLMQGENLFDPFIYGAKFGQSNSLQVGQTAQNLILKGDSLIYGKFLWKPKCEHVRDKPYKISFVLRDRNCPDAKDDSLHVFIHVKNKINNHPVFISPDTISTHKVLKYYLYEEQTFSLKGDSILKTYDKDSLEVVNIMVQPDPTNEGDVNTNYYFASSPSVVNSTAEFFLQTDCYTNKPHRFTFLAYDNNCIQKDTVKLTIEIYVLPSLMQKEVICGVAVDTSFSQYNIVYWNQLNSNAASYFVYKENKFTSEYEYAGTTFDTSFVDINVNTAVQNETYKIIALNKCGTKSVISEGVKSLFLSSNYLGVDGVQLSWDGHSGSSSDSFIVWKKIDNSVYIKIASLANTNFTYIDSNYTIANKTSYIVELDNSLKCSIFRAGRREGMISNQSYVLMNGVDVSRKDKYFIKPNPSSNYISIMNLPEGVYTDVLIFDLHGKIVLKKQCSTGELINISELSNGVYTIKVKDHFQKLIKI